MTVSDTAPNALNEAEARFRAGDDAAAVRLLQSSIEQPACALRLREWACAERRIDLLDPALAQLERGVGPEADISRAIRLQLAGNPLAAFELIRPILGAHPGLATAHHHAGRALHNLGRRAEALAALRLAVQLRPDYAEAWYSLAHALRASNRLEDAVAAYRACLQRLPTLRAALLNLGITLSAADHADAALQPLDRLLDLDPQALDAWINKGLCLHVLGRIDAARRCYGEALARDPRHPQAHFYLGCLLNEQGNSTEARAHLEAALRATPDDPDVLTELAGLAEQGNELDVAVHHVACGLAVAPEHPGLLLEAARLARREGRIDEARERLDRMEPDALPARVAQQYWFERALMHDRGDEVEEAIGALERGNALASLSPRRRGIDRSAFPRRIEEVAEWLGEGARGAQPDPVDPSWKGAFRPAFLVGFPRSGTTLLDTLLDAHDGVASIEEHATLEAVSDVLFTRRGGYPKGMRELDPAAVARAHRLYAEAVRPWLPPGFRGLLLDKLPLRLLRVPLIARVLPNAPILFAQRHPCDVVLSNVMQQFRPNEAFVHFDSVESAARIYDRVMRVWRSIVETLPLRLHSLRYESLVASPEIELAAVCRFLEIPFDSRVLDPATRLAARGRVQTNSYQQVAEPVYRRAAGRWRRYERWLQPVMPVLQPHIDWLGYAE